MGPDTDTLLRLVHDVGKHGTRAASNWPPAGPAPAVLVKMLVDDVYGDTTRRRLSEVFDGLVAGGALPEVRAELAAIDALEAQVRDGDADAAREVATRAVVVRETLGALLEAAG